MQEDFSADRRRYFYRIDGYNWQCATSRVRRHFLVAFRGFPGLKIETWGTRTRGQGGQVDVGDSVLK